MIACGTDSSEGDDCHAGPEKKIRKKQRRRRRRPARLIRSAALSVNVLLPTLRRDEFAARLHMLGDGAIDLRPSTIEGAGLGLFALREFVVGEPITAYDGLLVSYDEARRLRLAGQDTHLRTHMRMRFAIDGRRLADTGELIVRPHEQMRSMGLGAMANDSTEANAEFAVFDSALFRRSLDRFVRGDNTIEIDPSERIVYLRAAQPIAANTEIFVHYGADYWNLRNE